MFKRPILLLILLGLSPVAAAQAQTTAPVGAYVNAQSAPSPARAAFAAKLYSRIRDRNNQTVLQAAQRLAGDTAKRVDTLNPGHEDMIAAICDRDYKFVYETRLADFDAQMTNVIASVFSDAEVATIESGATLPPVTKEKFNTDMGISNGSLVWISQINSEYALPQLTTDLRANNLHVPPEMYQTGSNS